LSARIFARRSIDLDQRTKTIRLLKCGKEFFSLLQGGIEMCPAQVNDEFEVTINETHVTAVHREHKHQYFFPRTPSSPELGPATWRENLSAERGAQDYVDSAHEAARLELQRAGILTGSEF
jgi:hypothetical protein